MENLEYLKSLLDIHPELQYEIIEQYWTTDFLRFYHSQTNYNISKETTTLSATIYKGKKSFNFMLDNATSEKIDNAVHNALTIIDKLPEDPYFVDLENDKTLAKPREVKNNIEAIPLKLKTEILSRIAEAVAPHNFDIFGSFVCNYQKYRLINSNGLDKTSENSPYYLEVKAVHNKSQVTVIEAFGGEDFQYFREQNFIEHLLQKIGYCFNDIVDIEPGTYDVILAPRCLGEFAQYLAYGMHARSLDQHSSFFEGKLNQKVFPEWVSICDDPDDPEIIHKDYGSNGHIYRYLSLVDNGIFRNFMCDNYYSHKTGLPKNGNTGSCLKIEAGDKTLDEMIGSVKHGLFISSLHYMNFINPKETSITGLTRDGTFLIENGKITKVVNNLRFTEKVARIFEHIQALENRSHPVPFSGNYEIFDIETVKSPHALVRDFNISSSTKTI
ncbi:MAG TPA: TldD/PmbA family protein [Candidatus Syntrophosphaera thermopropionivorans]|jgi:predicted Zn-dependent protease|nr:TldD/PmbA family protein [Candidatus Syntrophosphaera thermopropionivorans]